MKKVEIYISVSFGCRQCSGYGFEIEVEDDASDEEIKANVEQAVFELVNWGYEIKGSDHA